MDFISNLIKRPISLVLNDAVPTTEQMHNSARSSRSQTPPSPFGRGASPPQNGHCIATALRLTDEFLPIAAPIRASPSPPATPTALLSCLHSNGSSMHSNSATSNTIEELLIQINDSLNQATMGDDATTENHNKSPVCAAAAPITISTAELSPKSAGLKLSPSPPLKETVTTLTTSTTVAMAPAANATSAEEATLQSLRSKAGLFDGLPYQLNHNTGVNTACTKFVGLTEFDESNIPELPGHLNPNIEEHLKLTFEEGLIPTLTANVNQEQQGTSTMQKEDINNKVHQQLFVPHESETAVSSDSEIFAECQSYQDGVININSDYMGDEFNAENSGMDAFFSAANSRNTTITNTDTSPLDTTIAKALAAAKANDASQPEERVETPSPIFTAAVAAADNITPQEEQALEVAELKPLEHGLEMANACLVNVTFDDEPMDVDVSLTQEQFLQSGSADVEAPSPKDVNSVGDSSVEEVVAAVKTCDHNDHSVKSANTSENESVGSISTTGLPSLDNTNSDSFSVSAGSELEMHQSKHEVSLNKSVELPTQHSEKNSLSKCELQDSKVDSSANDLCIGSPITDATPNTTIASAASSHNTSAENCKADSATKIIELSSAEMTASQKSLAETTGKVNALTEMNSSVSSRKSSTCSSPGFPIKRDPNDLKLFPRSPTKVVEKPMTYLEKSEYTERKEIERKKSLATEIEIVPTTPPKEVQNDVEATTKALADLNCPIDLCAPQSDKFPISPTTVDGDALNCTFNGCKSEEATSSPSRNTADTKMLSMSAILNESDHKTRRTFTMSPLNKTTEGRRTFNVSPTHQDEVVEPMDVDDTLPLSSPTAQEPPSIENIQREENESDAATIPSPTLSTSPPVPTLMNRQRDDAAIAVQPLPTTITTSPPIATLMNRQNNLDPELVMPPVPKTVPVSPPVPALMKREIVGTASPSEPVQSSCKRDEATFMMPPPPPPSRTTVYSPPIPTLQKRPPIHPAIDPLPSMEVPEALSAKEQTKSNASDEKDVFAGNCTPSPMEEASSVGFSGFGDVDVDGACGQEKFNDSDFQTSNNLIFNPSDFDYLLTKGNNNAPVDRSSILLRFDPLLGVPVAASQLPPVKPAQQLLQQILGNNALSLSPTLEEDEARDNCTSFEVEHKNRSFETNLASKSAKFQDEQSADVTEEYTQGNQPQVTEEHNPTVDIKKDVRMSVDVIKDMNVNNDCNKSFENSNLQSDEKQINYKMDELEKKIKNEVLKTEDIEKKLKEAEQREEALIKRITDKDKTITKMNGVIEAYEKAIAELIAEKEQLIQNYEKQLSEVKADRDSNYQHLTSLETTFSDLHVKYEKSKEMTLQLKSNEEVLMAEKRQILENLRLQEQRYDKMKNHAMQQLEIANKKLETLNKEHSVESTKLKALLKKEEISRASINEQLQQKSRENAELVKICDELINGQGS